MASDDLAVAREFLAALENAARRGEHEGVLELLAPDVEWITPQRTLSGIDEVRTWRIGGSSGESFDFEFVEDDWVEHGDGQVACDVRQVYRVKETGDFAYERKRRIELTIRAGRISRYEIRSVG